MDAPWTEDEATKAAARFFEEVAGDLLRYGGVQVGREKPLLRSHAFACAVFDKVAVILASKYQCGELDYSSADGLANRFQSLLNTLGTWPKDGSGIGPKRWYEVYEAFDAGEWDHFGRSSDPVAEFTNPQVTEFLAKHG